MTVKQALSELSAVYPATPTNLERTAGFKLFPIPFIESESKVLAGTYVMVDHKRVRNGHLVQFRRFSRLESSPGRRRCDDGPDRNRPARKL